jgi:hypothetical protein
MKTTNLKFKVVYFPLLIALFLLICYLTNFRIINVFAQLDEDWKTFVSPQYIFSINYPPDQFIQNDLNDSSNPELSIIKGGNLNINGGINVFLNIYHNNTSLLKDFDKEYGRKNKTYSYYLLFEKPSYLTINNVTGITFSFVTNDTSSLHYNLIHKEFVFIHDNYIFRWISIGGADDFNNLQYNRMIKSIKFFD